MATKQSPAPARVVPADWLPTCRPPPRRAIVHWTAGANFPSAEDKEAYHILIDRVGHVHRGDYSICDNSSTLDGTYAAHTRGFNSGSIGLALCGMAGANETPFAPGKFPITAVQWNAAIIAAAQLCARYDIEPDREHLLMHCEVEEVHGIKQAGKFDISVRTWKPPEKWAKMPPGSELRCRVAILLREL